MDYDQLIIQFVDNMVALYLFVVGAAVGSFINVVAFRFPAGRSLVRPSSRCPHCQKPLKGLELMPILGWIFVGGRCRLCRSPISIRYPVVECAAASLFGWVAIRFAQAPWWVVLKWLIFCGLLTTLLLIDLDRMIIPTELVVPGIWIGLGFGLLEGELSRYAIAALAGYAVFYSIMLIGGWVFKKEAMGGGDLRLAAMMGAFLGGPFLGVAVFLSFLIGAAAGALFLAARKAKGEKVLGNPIPFGPMMAAGSVLAIFYGQRIIDWYFGMTGL